jgi:hypothetical protein
METGTMQERGPQEREAFKGLPLYLYTAGVAALLAAPFLTWFNFGDRTTGPFPSQMSLVWQFENGYQFSLILYLLGVAAALLATWVTRRPFASVVILTAAFPVFILFITLSTFFDGSMAYAQALTVGVFTSLFGSALLESSYFAYQRSFAKSMAFNQ